jgi:hypothetical protein
MPGARRKKQKYPPDDDYFDFQNDPIKTLVSRALEHPQVQGILIQTRDVLDGFGYVIDRAARRPAPEHPRARRDATPPPAQPAPRGNPLPAARVILHFGPTEKLTAEAIKKRRKKLAEMCHPDRGGSDEAMRRINTAADVLLGSLKA